MHPNQIFQNPVQIQGNFYSAIASTEFSNQRQTNEIFSSKWNKASEKDDMGKFEVFQFDWYLKLYGFDSEDELASFLQKQKVILDAGCGLGYKAAWFARLAPEALVIGMDFSEAAEIAARNYSDLKNLIFVRGDISDTGIREVMVDYVSCDQVIMHTEDPEKTFKHLCSLLSPQGQFACYVYAKKALPRELLDDYFRLNTHSMTDEERWELSAQLTTLGKTLSDLKISIESPDIPTLGIKGGEYDLQRFLYWNFLKCFWKEDWGWELSLSTNYDWYAPSNARRFSEDEYKKIIKDNDLKIIHFHKEPACYSGRLGKN